MFEQLAQCPIARYDGSGARASLEVVAASENKNEANTMPPELCRPRYGTGFLCAVCVIVGWTLSVS